MSREDADRLLRRAPHGRLAPSALRPTRSHLTLGTVSVVTAPERDQGSWDGGLLVVAFVPFAMTP